MYLIVLAILCFHDNVGANETDLMFDLDPDAIFKSLMGRDPNRIRETTYAMPSISDQDFLNFTKNNTVSQKFDKRKKNKPEVKKDKEKFKPEKTIRVKKIPAIENRMRELEIERIFANDLNPLPNFDKNEDDPTTITNKFDKLRAQIQKDGRRRYRYREIKQRNIMRNRTIYIMEHFVYETRYKLPHSQILRAKYHRSFKYRIGYCYGLVYQLKRQQMLMYTHLHLKQTKVSTLHMHMRIYEKVVRLDVDIKDTIRLIRTLESKRRLKEDPTYYEEYIEGSGGAGGTGGAGDSSGVPFHHPTTKSRPPVLPNGATRAPPPPG